MGRSPITQVTGAIKSLGVSAACVPSRYGCGG